MKTDKVIIKKSKIHSYGVFTNKDFKKGEIVLKWNTSKTLSKKEVNKLSDNEKQYIIHMNNKYILLPAPEKYVNHSCAANTTAKQFCDLAKRNIKKGEEITANYEENYKEKLPTNNYKKCNCGSKNCKGIMTSY